MTARRRRLALAPVIFFATTATGEIKLGQLSFAAERSCVASGKLNTQLCANAAANAQAEFDEKAPRFPTREACEQAFGSAGCSVGFSGADGWAGKKSGVYFTPRQAGFRVLVRSERHIIVVPFVAGRVIGFSPRTALERDTRIDPQSSQRARQGWRPRPPSDGSGKGVARSIEPSSAAGRDVPPPPTVDPNFDCAAVLEAGSDAETGCYPAPTRRR